MEGSTARCPTTRREGAISYWGARRRVLTPPPPYLDVRVSPSLLRAAFHFFSLVHPAAATDAGLCNLPIGTLRRAC